MINKLVKKIKETNAPVVVGLDPMMSYLPEHITKKAFEEYGETYFRNCETNLLIELQKKNNQIISCGGGVALRDENVAEMKKNGKVVLLTASPEVILERVKDNDDRPLLRGNKNTEFISNMMEQRRPKYEAAADVVVNTDYKTVEEIAEEIVVKLTRDAD